MERIAYAFHVAPDQESEIRSVAADISTASEEFGRTREELGLSALEVWLQSTELGPLVVLVFEGKVEEYFDRVRKEPGVDEWFREKIRQWAVSDAESRSVYEYPQSENLFAWRSQT